MRESVYMPGRTIGLQGKKNLIGGLKVLLALMLFIFTLFALFTSHLFVAVCTLLPLLGFAVSRSTFQGLKPREWFCDTADRIGLSLIILGLGGTGIISLLVYFKLEDLIPLKAAMGLVLLALIAGVGMRARRLFQEFF